MSTVETANTPSTNVPLKDVEVPISCTSLHWAICCLISTSVSCKDPKCAVMKQADICIAFEYGASATGASVDECEMVLRTQKPEQPLMLSSEDDHLIPPLLPTRRSPEAYPRFQTIPKESLYNSVRQARDRTARCLTRCQGLAFLSCWTLRSLERHPYTLHKFSRGISNRCICGGTFHAMDRLCLSDEPSVDQPYTSSIHQQTRQGRYNWCVDELQLSM